MEVISEPNIVSGHIKAFLDDHQWPKLLKILNGSKSKGELL
jgi:hypothetical protein